MNSRCAWISGSLLLLVLLVSCRQEPTQRAKATAPPAPPQSQPATTPALPDPAKAKPVLLPSWVADLLVEVEANPTVLELYEERALELSARLRDGSAAQCRWTLQGNHFDGCKVSVALEELEGDLQVTLELRGEGRQAVLYRRTLPVERLPLRDQGLLGGAEDSTLKLEVEPRVLEVLTDTTVTLTLRTPPGSNYTCLWEPGDQSPTIEGCSASHVYTGGLKDRLLKLKVLRDQRLVRSEAIPLLMERLPVRPDLEQPSEPPPAETAAGCQRLLITQTDQFPAASTKAFDALVAQTGAGVLALFLQGPGPDPQELLHTAEALALRGCSLIPLPCNGGQETRAELERQLARGPLLLQSAATELPQRLSAQWGRLFLSFLGPSTRLSLEDERWLSAQLSLGAVFPFRVFLTCGALDTLEAQDRGLLPSPYRIYEKLQRGDANLVISGAHPVYFQGLYGLLPLLSPGRYPGNPGTLLGELEPQGPSVAMLEFCEGRLAGLWHLVPEAEGWKVLPLAALPEKVGVFKRWGAQ